MIYKLQVVDRQGQNLDSKKWDLNLDPDRFETPEEAQHVRSLLIDDNEHEFEDWDIKIVLVDAPNCDVCDRPILDRHWPDGNWRILREEYGEECAIVHEECPND